MDMGKKMFKVRLSREDGTEWETRTWAKDEMDAYLITTERYQGAD